ncbi:MAG: Glycosyl transferase family 39, partial [Candidatus Daviesbacteria bacterium GW2011_GWA1_36_8]
MVKAKEKINWNKKALLLIILIGFLLRVAYISFPAFSSEEARISFRGYVLSSEGKDELGRDYPVLFNSSTDYQLPLVSYITALGVKLFGKNDLGVRIPFIIIGTLLIYLVYINSKKFLKDEKFNLISTFIAACSPALIYISKIPNESIVLIFLLLLIFYLLTKNKINLVLVSAVLILLALTSKAAWFIMVPFITLTIFIANNKIGTRQKMFTVILSLVFVIIAVSTFLLIPQTQRSFIENNFSIFAEQSLTSSINRLRGQGINEGWPFFVDRLLFNKLHILFIGLVYYLSQFSLSSFFGWFDTKSIYSFVLGGLLPKVTIIPFFLGIFLLIRYKGKHISFAGILMLSITFPALFVYPGLSLNLFILLTPILAFIAA